MSTYPFRLTSSDPIMKESEARKCLAQLGYDLTEHQFDHFDRKRRYRTSPSLGATTSVINYFDDLAAVTLYIRQVEVIRTMQGR